MSRVKKIVTSEIEGRNLSDFYGDNSYSFDSTGQINYYGENKMGPVIEPGIVYGSNADSGDGYGYNTLKLVPHSPDGYINDDRYLVIDPTAPNHIHIRAGGIQDASNAELILGGEQANVKVTDWNHQVYINTYNGGSSTSNTWTFVNDGTVYGPSEGGYLAVTGISSGQGITNLPIYSSGSMNLYANGGDMNFYMDGAAYIGPSESENRIAQIKDLNNRVSPGMVRYQPTFAATGLTFTGSGETYPTYNSYYVKSGNMVSFVIEVDCSTVTNFGTGQYTLELPFVPAIGYNHFSGWANVDTAVNPDVTDGHVILNVDHAGITSTLDLHYLKQAGGAHTPIIEGLFLQGTPVTLTTTSKIYVNGTYISA